ncbi:N-methyl-L-tryptophan oxidase [Congregibacter variabilis]|uniref:N-methyl-L-tryptophan oxidase n=1 Tax=Congregibacter variabilis TaxID=3081200 RepID=A0ABZ0I511_9GAMM|nr:N-methyl-L-tryptophan oxidase [Congregibacter sp. IMCC43200]
MSGSDDTYDLIVLGTGGIGSAALFSAASRGLKCLGIDRFPPAHDRGSSHGESRLIRLSYFEHTDYVPMLRRSYELWDELDTTLLHKTGGVYMGPKDGEIISGVLTSAAQHKLRIDKLHTSDIPQYKVPDDSIAIFEPDAGWLPVERCIQAHLDQARSAGAKHRHGLNISGWEPQGDAVVVKTDAGDFSAAALVITAGPWSSGFLPRLNVPLRVERKHLHWFRCRDKRYRNGFFYELPQGAFYGFPASNGRLKVAEHSGGELVTNPLSAHRNPSPQDNERIEDFVDKYLPGVELERLEHRSCFYTRSPDDDFILDLYPGLHNVAYTAGLSGHGYKFAPALGEILVDLATGKGSSFKIKFLSGSRFK